MMYEFSLTGPASLVIGMAAGAARAGAIKAAATRAKDFIVVKVTKRLETSVDQEAVDVDERCEDTGHYYFNFILHLSSLAKVLLTKAHTTFRVIWEQVI
jgi:hypothetical protein